MKKLLFILLSAALSLVSQAQDLRVVKTSAPQTVKFAEPFTAAVLLTHPQGQTLTLDPESVGKEFSVTKLQLLPDTPQSTQAQFTLMPFGIDKSTFTASFSLAEHPDVTVPVEIPITITPVKLFDDEELKEIRPPHRPFDWAFWLCMLLALVALVCLLIWWIRRIKHDASLLSTPKDNRPAHVIALSQIDALVDSGLWENKQYKVFYITLSDILRMYLERAFNLDVSAQTSAELLRHLKTVSHLNQFIQQLRSFLASGDLVKFAKVVPTQDARNKDITILRDFITQTAPKPAPTTAIPSHVEVKL
ncbi:MAG: hypothetical protein IJ876_00700 [Elusimicrobiaceae bacterium]|nr:hypothetical protein [Elusimicrobiaceae bacterium]